MLWLTRRALMADTETDERVDTSERASPQVFGTSVELVGGYVTPEDLEYAWDRVRCLSASAPRAVRQCRAHLCTDIDSDGRSRAIADAILVVDGDLVICAGAVATTMLEAIDQLSSRLRRRLMALRERDAGPSSRPRAMAMTAMT
jgi:ribosome-associated translation inhibitor RaiA